MSFRQIVTKYSGTCICKRYACRDAPNIPPPKTVCRKWPKSALSVRPKEGTPQHGRNIKLWWHKLKPWQFLTSPRWQHPRLAICITFNVERFTIILEYFCALFLFLFCHVFLSLHLYFKKCPFLLPHILLIFNRVEKKVYWTVFLHKTNLKIMHKNTQ